VYTSPNNIRVIESKRMRGGGGCNTYGGKERYIQIFDGET
jgi:hypothetical protein